MRPEIDTVLARHAGVASRAQLLHAVTRTQLDHEVRSGQLQAPFARAWCRPWNADDAALRHRAALTSVGPPAALSHLTALRCWGLLPVTKASPDDKVHITVPASRYPRPQDGLVVHRVARFPAVLRQRGLIVVTPAEAVVGSWPILLEAERRAPAITAVRTGSATCRDLGDVLDVSKRIPARRPLLDLVELLAAGCESELEIWGYLRVFDVPGLRHGTRQKTVRVQKSTYRLDLAYEGERVAFELDGRAFHAGTDQWERDIRRDAALATAGWQTVRFSHRRLHSHTAECRREALAVLAARQR